MAIRVALQHRTTYRFDRNVGLAPHEIRLRPAPHCRTPILGYSLQVAPDQYFLNWQQDPYGNWVARLVFTAPADKLEIVALSQIDTVDDETRDAKLAALTKAAKKTPLALSAVSRQGLDTALFRLAQAIENDEKGEAPVVKDERCNS